MHLIGASAVALTLGVSTRRVRALLAQGRIRGFKDKSGEWVVYWPFEVTPGKRGPDLRRFPVRHVYNAAKKGSK